MKGNVYDFSFSGIKTAVLYHLKRHPELQPEIDARKEALARGERSADALRKLAERSDAGSDRKLSARCGG